MIKISIVTASFNQGCFLEEMIQSVLSENYPNLEFIIIDGGSTDNSVEILKKYDSKLTYWISEKDAGQSDAFNKGFARATGDLMTWINADDVLLPGSLRAVAAAKEKHPECQWFTARTAVIDAKSRILFAIAAESPLKLIHQLGISQIHGPSSFFSKSAYDKTRGFDLSLYYTMDIDLWWQLYHAVGAPRLADCYAYGFRYHDTSKTMASKTIENYDAASDPKWEKIAREKRAYAEKYRCQRCNPGFRIGRLFSQVWKIPAWLKARQDTARMRGKLWKEVFHYAD